MLLSTVIASSFGIFANLTGIDLVGSNLVVLTLKVLVTTIVALGHFETGLLQHSARGWGK